MYETATFAVPFVFLAFNKGVTGQRTRWHDGCSSSVDLNNLGFQVVTAFLVRYRY